MGAAAPIQVESFPEKLECLFKPARYIVLYGGRGSGKSWGIARALLIRGMSEKLRVLCVREQQNSIKESVHKLLSDQIAKMGMSEFWEIQRDTIVNVLTGSSFFFEGIRQNVQKIKSYEGIDVCWPEEAHNISKTSWNVLIPTIRKAGSQIIVSFNPDLETDETYVRFVKNKDELIANNPGSIVQELNWRDNPWFTEEMRSEMEYLKSTDFDSYLNVWEGQCRQVLEGAVYADELRVAINSGRLTKVPYDETCPVSTFWDLGWADMTSIWFAQKVGMETRIIDFYTNHKQPLNHYLSILQGRGYIYDTLWLPHDAKAKQLGTGKSIQEQCNAKGFRTRIVPKLSLVDGINAARTVFPNCYFDKEKCAEGLKSLRHYRYEVVESPDGKTFSREPVHDQHSHAADGFRYLAVALKTPKEHRLGRHGTAELAFDESTGLLRRVPKFPLRLGNLNAWQGR